MISSEDGAYKISYNTNLMLSWLRSMFAEGLEHVVMEQEQGLKLFLITSMKFSSQIIRESNEPLQKPRIQIIRIGSDQRQALQGYSDLWYSSQWNWRNFKLSKPNLENCLKISLFLGQKKKQSTGNKPQKLLDNGLYIQILTKI